MPGLRNVSVQATPYYRARPSGNLSCIVKEVKEYNPGPFGGSLLGVPDTLHQCVRLQRQLIVMTRGRHRHVVRIVVIPLAALALAGTAWPLPQSSSPSFSAGTPAIQQVTAQSSAPSDLSSDEQGSGTITGTVLDQSGAVVSNASIILTRRDQTPPKETLSDENGRFAFSNVLPGPFQLSINLPGFVQSTSSGVLNAGDTFFIPPVSLALAAVTTQVEVRPQEEIAQAQMKEQEKQRIGGVVPNFYVTYLPDPAPLDARQKFELAWKTTIDPVTLGFTAAIAGVSQWQGQFSGYGRGAQAYPKYLGASYGDVVVGTFLGSAILPSLLKQDPRYFYKGTGGTRFRLLYALANTVICKGDNKRWQPNYSSILGNLAAGGLSNLYYPPQNRSVSATLGSALIGMGAGAASNIFEEFLSKRLTPHLPSDDDSEKSPRRTLKLPFPFAYEGQ